MTATELRPWLDALIAADTPQAYIDVGLVGMGEFVTITAADGQLWVSIPLGGDALRAREVRVAGEALGLYFVDHEVTPGARSLMAITAASPAIVTDILVELFERLYGPPPLPPLELGSAGIVPSGESRPADEPDEEHFSTTRLVIMIALLLVGVMALMMFVDHVIQLVQEIAAGRGVIPRGWSEAYPMTPVTELVTLVAMAVAVVVAALLFWWREKRLERGAGKKLPPKKE